MTCEMRGLRLPGFPVLAPVASVSLPLKKRQEMQKMHFLAQKMT
jgi:hypothetical protein